MEKKEFYQQAMLMAFNALLSANGNAYETEYVAPHQTTAAMAHDYALALTQKMYIEINKDINNLK
jgi:hypothetical protein